MAKKGLLVLVLASALAGGVWAQDAADAAWDGKQNFVTADLGLVFSVFSLPIGVRYERLLTPNISVGADFYWGYMIAVVTEFDAGVFARYYLWEDLFVELGLGYHEHLGDEDSIITAGFAISPGLGWKFDPGAAGGFIIDLGATLPITIGEKKKQTGDTTYTHEGSGAAVGFMIYAGFGWAF